MKPIEPGCLAIIVNSFALENIGKTVQVEKSVRPGEEVIVATNFGDRKGTAAYTGWLVVSAQNLLVSRSGCLMSNKAVYKDEWLMRIGDDSVQDVLKKVVENVE